MTGVQTCALPIFITPYKLPAAREKANKAFNFAHSKERIKIEHSFGVLKARWPSLRSLPVRIRHNVQKDHLRVIQWIMACLVLHNFLVLRHEDESWLTTIIEEIQEEGQVIEPEIRPILGDIAMKAAGEVQRAILCYQIQES